MITSNKKLIKNFKDILTAANNAKSIILAEIEKVDAKYAALAEKEKAEFNRQIKSLDSQIEMCNGFLSSPETTVSVTEPETTESTVTEQETVEPVASVSTEEEKIVDTLFEENNTQEEEENVFTEPVTTEEVPVVEEVVEAEEKHVVEDANAEEIESAIVESNDEWPDFPEEWN